MEFGKDPHLGFILSLQPNTFQKAPHAEAEGAEWKQGGLEGAGSGGLPWKVLLPDKAEPGAALLA